MAAGGTRAGSGRRSILIVAVIAVLMAAGGFFAATLVISPEDAAARTAPPPAGPITVPVDRKSLNADIVTRGDIGFTGSVEVELADGTAANAIVTGKVPEVGSEVTNGSVLLEVTGRPVIALSGDLPTYRSLAPGSSGPDVQQLEATLAALGFDPGPQDSVYDTATGAAVAALYQAVGYPAPQPAEDAAAAVAAAEAAVTSADQAVTDARNALEEAAAGPSQSERLALQGAIDAAQAAYDQAKITPSAPDPAKVAEATRNLQAATDHQAYVAENLQAAIDQEWANLADWQAAAVEAARLVTNAQAALDAANAGGPPDPTAIAAAKNSLDIAKAQRDEALQVDTSAQQAALTAAQESLTAAQAQLETARTAAATPLPAQELVWLAQMPRRVDEVRVARGSVVDGPLLLVSGADLSVRARVSADEASLLTTGMTAQLGVPGGGSVTAVISSIGGTTPGGDGEGEGATGTPVVLQPQNVTNEQAQQLRGANVKVTIPVASTSGEVLVVPVAGLFSDAGGTPRVEVLLEDGTTRFQSVLLGLSTNGEVEVTPVDADGTTVQPGEGTLDEGSLIVVGR